MASRYIIKYNDGAVEMTKPNSTILIYKIPYTNLKALNPGFVIPIFCERSQTYRK